MSYQLIGFTENLKKPQAGDVIQIQRKFWIMFDGTEWSQMDFFQRFEFTKQMENQSV